MTAYSTPDDSFGTNAANAVTFLAGVWLIVAPWALSYDTAAATVNDMLVGVAVAVATATGAALTYRRRARVREVARRAGRRSAAEVE